ncbi:hypothetical protein E2C01_055343 [Portunus trituberculatus]|uniref:Uncharacterized protein n=1 Tax=Portunus trituberculatus TaxID=210409 RepID=A0A5B7GXF6_PORTR|nr:hypothetical protein [Portunus trituberculatus]
MEPKAEKNVGDHCVLVKHEESQNAFEAVLHEPLCVQYVDVKNIIGYCDLVCGNNYTQKAHADGLGCEKPVGKQSEAH